MKAGFHPDADDEFQAAVDWYEVRRDGLGGEFEAEVRHAVKRIEEIPTSFPVWPELPVQLPVQRLVLLRFPFALAFLNEGTRLTILAVAHTSREPFYWVERAALH